MFALKFFKFDVVISVDETFFVFFVFFVITFKYAADLLHNIVVLILYVYINYICIVALCLFKFYVVLCCFVLFIHFFFFCVAIIDFSVYCFSLKEMLFSPNLGNHVHHQLLEHFDVLPLMLNK